MNEAVPPSRGSPTSVHLLPQAGWRSVFAPASSTSAPEGQIALGGVGAAAVALAWPSGPSALPIVAALIGAAAFAGALWAGLRDRDPLGRRVHEVLATLLLNFVALLLVQQASPGRSASSERVSFSRHNAGLWKAPELRDGRMRAF